MINISNVVNVDFKIIKSQAIIGSYKSMVYFIKQKMTVDETTSSGTEAKEKRAIVCTSQDDVEKITFADDAAGEIKYNAKQFFINRGVQLILITASGFTLTHFKDDIEYARALSNDFIYVTINNTICDVDSSQASNGYTSGVIGDIVRWMELLKSPQTLRLLLTKNIKSGDDNTATYNYAYINAFKDYSVGVKFTSKLNNGKVIDAALLIGAYFTQVNLNNVETIKDYCYTPEEILKEEPVQDPDTELTYTKTTNIASEDVVQSVYSKLVANNYNFIDTIGSKIINFGGNLANGISISTDFATICAENDVCAATLNSIMEKQYLNEQGLTNMVATINSQLRRYIDNGYLHTNSYYSGEDLYITYNGKSYNVINKGDVLVNGYMVFAVPVADISIVDKEEKRFPPIYVVIESLAGARTITIQGEVR